MNAMSASVVQAQGPADVFREFAQRYSRAERAYANARHTERASGGADAALSMKQALESEFARCFLQTKFPDWDFVEQAARGEWDIAR